MAIKYIKLGAKAFSKRTRKCRLIGNDEGGASYRCPDGSLYATIHNGRGYENYRVETAPVAPRRAPKKRRK